jgi:2-(1,2-epoxy-1,2-dihydrophenyl)acetyl-CoA isomerase
MTGAGGATGVVQLERAGPLAIVTLNRPERLNALDAETRDGLATAMHSSIDDESVRAILLTGRGRAFCAGADLEEMIRSRAEPNPPPGGDLLRDIFNPLIERMVSASKPIVAALNGPAVGVGCSLALAADIVVSAKSASFNFAFAKLGAVPDAGLTAMLPKRIGESRALAAMLLAEGIGANEAKSLGLIHQIFSDDDLHAASRALASKLAHGPTRAYAAIKALARSGPMDIAQQLALEAKWQDEAFKTSDLGRGVAAFLARQAPEFQGR